MLSAGDQAPDFKLSDLTGREWSLGEISNGKPALIALFKVSCPVCQLTMPYLERLSKSDTVAFVAISQDNAAATAKFNQSFGVTFPTLLDTAQNGYAVSNAFDITHVPSLFLVDPERNITMAVSGFSKKDLEWLGDLAGIAPFRDEENVPAWKAG